MLAPSRTCTDLILDSIVKYNVLSLFNSHYAINVYVPLELGDACGLRFAAGMPPGELAPPSLRVLLGVGGGSACTAACTAAGTAGTPPCENKQF